jgi:hypothetical protein
LKYTTCDINEIKSTKNKCDKCHSYVYFTRNFIVIVYKWACLPQTVKMKFKLYRTLCQTLEMLYEVFCPKNLVNFIICKHDFNLWKNARRAKSFFENVGLFSNKFLNRNIMRHRLRVFLILTMYINLQLLRMVAIE